MIYKIKDLAVDLRFVVAIDRHQERTTTSTVTNNIDIYMNTNKYFRIILREEAGEKEYKRIMEAWERCHKQGTANQKSPLEKLVDYECEMAKNHTH